jgi:EmrB/QacA subfamily drug resistance transporter
MRQPCDEAVMASGKLSAPCQGKSAFWILAAAILGSSMAFIDSTVVNVAMPALQSTLHATVVDVQWVVESYAVVLSALILVGGALGDLVGRRLIFVVGTSLFAAASFGCGISSTISQLIIWRSVQGVGAAALVPSSLAIISASFGEADRGRAIGTWSGFTAITTALGPVLGGWLIQHASWHWVFLINIPLAAAVIVISMLHVPESRRARAGTVDWLGAVAAILSLGGLVYGFLESAILGWTNLRVDASLLVGSVSLVFFVLVETRAADPMMPLDVFKSRSFSGANLLTFLLYASLGIFFFLFPLNLIQVQGYSATATGAASMPMILLMFVLSRWSGGLVSRLGPRRPLILGPLIAAAGFLLFAVPSVGASYWTTFFPAFLVLGFGMAVTVAPLTTVVMSSVEDERIGIASGINNAIARVAGVLAIAIFGIAIEKAFGHRLEMLLSRLRIDPAALNIIRSNLVKLGGLDPPSNLDPAMAWQVRADIVQAFVFGFRYIMLVCALLAAASAWIAFRTIPRAAPGQAHDADSIDKLATSMPAIQPSPQDKTIAERRQGCSARVLVKLRSGQPPVRNVATSQA